VREGVTMNVSGLQELAARWRSEAELYRRRGLEQPARMAESFAAELEQRLDEWRLEALTLDQAAAESGYSYSALQKAVSSGAIPTAGDRGRPRIRRCDLPRKPAGKNGGPDLAGERLRSELET
jgi:hypothetical protein